MAVGGTLAAMTLFGAPAALANGPGVTQTGEFELEATTPLNLDSKGNIITSTSGTTSEPDAVDNTSVPGDDWANVYNRSIGSGTPDSASSSRFLTDGVGGVNEDLFTGGGSKDPNNISSWQWTTGAGVQDKNDIEHAYAARYNATATLPPYLFFGLDRYATAGDATLGFWFLKGTVAKSSGGTFTGVHHNNDLLVQIDYTTGGAQPTVAISHWSNGALVNDATSNTQLCGASSSATYCASTNLHDVTAPWAFVLKGTAGNSPTFAGRTFFEGGINLSSFGLDQDCFSTFLAETRSSQSFTSTLSDFVSGSFSSCGASMTTTPSAGETDATAVSPGTSVTDTATITGTGTTNPPFPNSSTTAPGTGNKVKFYLCGPMATGTCTSTADADLVSQNDLTATSTQGASTATSGAVNTTSAPLTPGRYCWNATWAGDQNYTAPVTESNATAECFRVRTIATTTVTTPQDGSGTQFTTSQPLGTEIFDGATVTALGSYGGPITGSVAFFLCDPTQVSGGVCPDGAGTAVGTPDVTPVANSDPPSATATSNGTHANSAGTWCFRATFTPTGSTYTGSGDGRSSECVTIDKAPTTTTTTPTLQSSGATVTTSSYLPVGSSVYDHAVVSSTNAAAGAPTGSVHFYVCDPTQLVGGVCTTSGTDLGTSSLVGTSSSASAADSSVVTANKVGTWCFLGVYGGDDNYLGSSDAATTECFTVKDTTTATSAQTWLPNDSATITSADSGTTVAGTISIALHESSDCSGAAVAGQTYTSGDLTGTGSITYSTSNSTYQASTSRSVSWLVTFTSDNDNLVGSSTHCESSSLTITN